MTDMRDELWPVGGAGQSGVRLGMAKSTQDVIIKQLVP